MKKVLLVKKTAEICECGGAVCRAGRKWKNEVRGGRVRWEVEE
jgi:hypothetical protein